MAADAGTIKGFLDLDIKGFMDSLDEASSAAESKLSGMENATSSKMQGIGKSAMKAGTLMTAGLTTPILGVGAAAISTASDWEKSNAQMQSSLGVTEEDAKSLTNTARDIYKNGFGESFDETSKAVRDVRMQLGDLNESDLSYVTTGVMNLSDTFDMDMNESIRGVNGLMEGFGLSATEAMDLLAAGAQNGLNYTDELADNIAEYGPRLAQMGFSADEYFQMLANGAESGAYNLDKCNDFLNEFQTSLMDGRVEEQLGSFSQGTQDLFAKWKNGQATAKEVYESIMTDFAGMEDGYEKQKLASSLWSSLGEDNAIKMIEAMQPVGDTFKDVSGKSQEMADQVSDNLQNKTESAIRSVNDAIGELGESATGPLSALADAVKSVADWFSGLDEGTQQVIVTIGLVIAAIGPLLMVFGSIASGVMNIISLVSTISGLLPALGGVITALTSPIGIVIAAITAVAAVVMYLWNTNEGFREFITGMWNGICEFFSGLPEFFSNLWTSITTFATETWTNFTTFIGGIWNDISTTAQSVFQGIADFLSLLWTSITTTAQNAWNGIVSFLSGLWTGISTTASTVFNGISTFLANIWNTISATVNSVWTGISSFISSIFSGISSTISNIAGNILNFMSNAWNNLKTITSNAFNGIKDAVSSALNNVVSFVGSIPSRILGALGNVGNLLWNAGASIINGLWNGLKSAASNMFNWVGGIAGKIASLKGPLPYDRKLLIPAGEAIIGGLHKSMDESFKEVLKDVKGMAPAIADGFGNEKLTVDMEAKVPDDATIKKMMETSKFMKDVADMSKTQHEVQFNDERAISFGGFDYDRFGDVMMEKLSKAPIQNNFDINMEDGDVIMDGERVGRKVAPVVSRVQAKDVKGKVK